MITLFVPVVASAQVTVFSDNFSSSTINASVSAPPTPTSTSYEEIASKKWSPSPPTVTAGDLKFGLASTSGGGTEVQALFTTTPVVLQNAGDSIQLAVVFTATQGILTSDTQWGIGLFDAGQVAPWGGGLNNSANNSNADAAVGGAQNWQGCIAQIANGSLNSQFAVRKQREKARHRLPPDRARSHPQRLSEEAPEAQGIAPRSARKPLATSSWLGRLRHCPVDPPPSGARQGIRPPPHCSATTLRGRRRALDTG